MKTSTPMIAYEMEPEEVVTECIEVISAYGDLLATVAHVNPQEVTLQPDTLRSIGLHLQATIKKNLPSAI